MPQFSYSAVDASGRTVQGVMDATTENELIVRLSGQGLRVQSLTRQTGAAPVAPRPAQAAPPVQRPAPAPVQPVSLRPQFPQVSPAPAKPSGPVPNLRLRPSTDAELYFFFSQLSNLLRSGIPATEALSTIADRHRHPEQAKAYRHMAQMTSRGMTIADAMSVFDELFPPGAVGAIRAGEAGGYAWEACQMVADTANSSLKLRRFTFWLSLAFWSSLLSLPFLGVAAVAIDRSVQAIDNGKQPLQEMGLGVVQGLLGPWGWLLFGLLAAYLYLNRQLRKAKYREFRHNFCMKVPILRKRTEGENMALFNEHLSKLGRAGISPYTSWKLAAAAVPNKAFSDQLAHAGSTMHENTRLSQVIYTSHVFPMEMGPLIENGEITGTLPNALEQAAQVGHAQTKQAETGIKFRIGCWVMVVMLLATGLSCAVPYRALYEAVFKHVMSDQ